MLDLPFKQTVLFMVIYFVVKSQNWLLATLSIVCYCTCNVLLLYSNTYSIVTNTKIILRSVGYRI